MLSLNRGMADAVEQIMSDLGDDLQSRARKYLDAKIYQAPNRGYVRTHALYQSLRITNRTPTSVTVAAGSPQRFRMKGPGKGREGPRNRVKAGGRGGGAPYAAAVEFKHFKHAGDLSFMGPAYNDITKGIGYEPALERIANAVRSVRV